MNKIPFLLFLSILLASCAKKEAGNNAADNDKPVFNKLLADSLGADEYGMRKYFLVILKTGEKSIDNKTVVDSIFRGHLDNIGKLTREGKLIIAGPLGKNDKQYRGIFVFRVETKEEVESLLLTDPAIKEQLLASEILEWYGSAALPMYLDFHAQIEKSKP